MTAEQYYDINEVSDHKTPKERRRFTYWDLIKFAEAYHKKRVQGEYLKELIK